MMLYKSKRASKVDKVCKQITVALQEREREWTKDQRRKMTLRIEEKMRKALNEKDYTRKLLKDCKSWTGPADSG